MLKNNYLKELFPHLKYFHLNIFKIFKISLKYFHSDIDTLILQILTFLPHVFSQK